VSHMVIFRSTDGKPGYHQIEGLEEAVRFVERLRNTENVEQARIYKMDEVGFTYKPYYKVEIASGDERGAPAHLAEPAAPAPAAIEPAPAADPEAPVPVMVGTDGEMVVAGDAVGANGRRGLFGR
jgi:hypothetical protein